MIRLSSERRWGSLRANDPFSHPSSTPRRTFTLLTLLVFALGVCVSLVSAPAAAQPAAEATPPAVKSLSESLTGIAKAEYEGGRILFKAGDYKNAIVKFQEAHKVSKDPRLLWNIAVCQKQLRQYSKMLTSLRRYRKDAKDTLTPRELERADAIEETVTSFISDLKLTVDQANAQVFVDGEMVGVTPLVERVTMDVGVRTLTIRKDGFKPDEREVTVPGGGEVTIDVRMVRDLHRGKLVINAGPNDVISLDGKVVGQGSYSGSVKSGPHTLKVTAPEMAAYQSEVVIQDDKERRIEVELNPLATDPTATILWVVGGVTLAAGATVAAVFIFQPDTGPTIEGTIPPGSVQLNTPGAGTARWGNTINRGSVYRGGMSVSTPMLTLGAW